MENHTLIRRLKRGDPGALETTITSYGTYVATVIRNQLGRFATPEDVEELSSDAFVSLWQNRSTLKTERLRGWLGATARNCARDFLHKVVFAFGRLDQTPQQRVLRNKYRHERA